MSQLKVNTIRHTGASSDAVTLASDGSCTVKATNNLSNRNLISNPEMRIDQRNSGSTYSMNPSSGNPTYGIVDRWFFQNYSGEAARYDVTKSTDVPANQGFTNSLKIDTTTAMGTPSGNNFSALAQYIEAQDCVFLNHGNANAKTLSLSFWIKSTKTGTACISMMRDDADRTYVGEYTISSSNTWEKKTITIPGDTTGTACANDNGRGFILLFPFFTGSSRHQTAGSWAARPGNWYGASSNQVNLVDSTSNDIYITGVSLTATDYFPDFEHRSYDDELARCQRYYHNYKGDNGDSIGIAGAAWGTTTVTFFVQHPVTMRANPTIEGSGNCRFQSQNDSAAFAISDLGIQNAPTDFKTMVFNKTSTSGATASAGGSFQMQSDGAILGFNAEL